MWPIVAAGFLLAHGLIHVSYVTKPPAAEPGAPAWPFHLDDSWGLSYLHVPRQVQRRSGVVLTAAVVACFAVAALVLAVGSPAWQPVAAVAALLSFVQLVVWFHPWLSLGLILDATILAVAWGVWSLHSLPGA